jgi:cytochrome c oxidase subunit 1
VTPETVAAEGERETREEGDRERRERERFELEEAWRREPGFWGFLTDVNHRAIAKRYIVTAFIFFGLGGIEAAMIRAQLARPENQLIGPDLYNQIFTMHGTTMMFLFAVPVMQAVGLLLVPPMVGTRNVAFPRLNALGYWVYLAFSTPARMPGGSATCRWRAPTTRRGSASMFGRRRSPSRRSRRSSPQCRSS